MTGVIIMIVLVICGVSQIAIVIMITITNKSMNLSN